MPCARCTRHPVYQSVDRICAFDDEGRFQDENWHCATMDALIVVREQYMAADYAPFDPGFDYVQLPPRDQRTVVDADKLLVVPADPESDGGWIVLVRNGDRPVVLSAVHVPPGHTLTIGVAETALAWAERQRQVTS